VAHGDHNVSSTAHHFWKQNWSPNLKKVESERMVLKGVSNKPDPTSVFKLHPDFRRSREVPHFVVSDIMQKAHPSDESKCSTLKRPKVRRLRYEKAANCSESFKNPLCASVGFYIGCPIPTSSFSCEHKRTCIHAFFRSGVKNILFA